MKNHRRSNKPLTKKKKKKKKRLCTSKVSQKRCYQNPNRRFRVW
jgi:hypothetical protein